MAALKKINLLPADEFEKTPLGQFLKWALTIGRYIVIATELVVILAFLSRFKLDKELADLNDETKAHLAVIGSFQELETKTRTLQFQLENIKKLTEEKFEVDKTFDFVAKNTPLAMILTSIGFNKDDLDVDGVAFSNIDLATFLSRLEESGVFEKISIEEISHGGEEAAEIEFSLKANFKTQEE